MNRQLTVILALLSAAPAHAQSMEPILATIKADNAWTVSQQKSICEIAAPPFKESMRAAEFKRRMDALGYKARIDGIGNVIAERPGTGKGPTIVLAGHLDTVFPEGTDVRVHEENGRLKAPGIGDDCRGLAVVLSVARAYQRANPRHDGRIIFVGDVGEEGAGNSRGTRYLFEKELKGQIDYFISVDGTGLGVTSASAAARLRIVGCR